MGNLLMDLGGEVFRLDIIALRHQDPAFDDRFELAHIARPTEVHEDFQRRLGNPQHPVTGCRAVFSDKEIGQRGDIAPPFPKRRKVYPDDIKPVVKVVTEIPFLDFRFQVPVGCGNYADINRNIDLAADPADLLLLDRPQELGLHAPHSSRRFRRGRRSLCRPPRTGLFRGSPPR